HVSRRRRSGVIAFAAHFHREVQTEECTLWVRFDQLMSSGALHIRTSTVRRHDKGPRIVGSSLQRLFILVIVRTNDVERLGFDWRITLPTYEWRHSNGSHFLLSDALVVDKLGS